MPPALTESLAMIAERWRALPGRLRGLLLLAVGLGLAVGGSAYVMRNVFVDYQVLFSNLSAEDAGAVVDALRGAKVPYRVGKNGEVLVPEARVHEWRLRLASQGVPSGGGVGFEIFDKNQFGLTDFSQRLNFQRALQGELARTIAQLKEVQQARVHLALPAPRVFSTQDKPPSASVVLRLRPGAALRQDQVRGIVHLVTASVEGLTPDRVTIVESSGRMLASGLDRVGGISAHQQEARTTVEQDVERRIQSILEPIVGVGRSAVRVAALVNLDQIERTEERFDGKPLIRSQNKMSEQTQGTSTQPTSIVNPGDKEKPAESSAQNRTQRESEQTTYEIARTIEKTLVTPGDIRRLSIAVLLDVPVVNGARTPRPDPEVDRIKKLVASAAGLRTDRNDEIEVLQVSFDPTVAPGEHTATETRPAAPSLRKLPLWAYGAAAAAALLIVSFLVWRARRRRKALLTAMKVALESNGGPKAAAAATTTTAPAPATAGTQVAAQRPAAASGPTDDTVLPPLPPNPLEYKLKSAEHEALRARLLTAAGEHPEQMAQIIRAWMYRRKPGA